MKIRSSYLWAGLVALAVVGWMVSDDLLSQSDDADKEMSSAAVGKGDALADEGYDGAKSSVQPASAERSFIVSARQVKNGTSYLRRSAEKPKGLRRSRHLFF